LNPHSSVQRLPGHDDQTPIERRRLAAPIRTASRSAGCESLERRAGIAPALREWRSRVLLLDDRRRSLLDTDGGPSLEIVSGSGHDLASMDPLAGAGVLPITPRSSHRRGGRRARRGGAVHLLSAETGGLDPQTTMCRSHPLAPELVATTIRFPISKRWVPSVRVELTMPTKEPQSLKLVCLPFHHDGAVLRVRVELTRPLGTAGSEPATSAISPPEQIFPEEDGGLEPQTRQVRCAFEARLVPDQFAFQNCDVRPTWASSTPVRSPGIAPGKTGLSHRRVH
jgi:hypothetical protein